MLECLYVSLCISSLICNFQVSNKKGDFFLLRAQEACIHTALHTDTHRERERERETSCLDEKLYPFIQYYGSLACNVAGEKGKGRGVCGGLEKGRETVRGRGQSIDC